MSDKPATASSNKSSGDTNKNMPVAAKPKTTTTHNTTQNASSGGSGVAIIATLISLATAGGGFYLWQELTAVQKTVATTIGIEQSDLDKLQSTLEKNIASSTDKTATELKSTVAATKDQLEKQIADSTAKASSQTDAVQSEAQASISSIEAALTETKASVQQTKTDVEGIISSTTTEIKDELNQAITSTNSEIASAKEELSQAITSANTEITSTNEELTSVKGSFSDLQQQIEERLATAEEAQANMHAAVEKSQAELTDAISRNRVDWAIAEVEHILRLAHGQVQLEQDVAKAITTLRTADQRLQSIAESEPTLTTVREAVEKDIASLSGVTLPDVSGTANTLGRLSNDVNKLQIYAPVEKPAEKTADNTEEASIEEEISTAAEIAANNSLLAVKGFATAAFEGIGGLVVVKKDEETVSPVVPPTQAFFVRQNLQLKLEGARLALLKQDNDTFHNTIKTAITWTEQYFYTDADSTKKFIDELTALGSLNIAPTLPDISGSLQALKDAQPN